MADVRTSNGVENGVDLSGDDDKEVFTRDLQEAVNERGAEVVDVGGDAAQTLVLSAEELENLQTKMRKALEAEGVSTENVSNGTLMRFLRARNLKVDVASKMYINHVMWRKNFVPKGFIEESDVANEIRAEKIFLQNKGGHRSVMVVLARNHDTKIRDLEETKRFAVYSIDKTIESLPAGEEKFCVLVDLGKCRMRNMDARAMISIFDFLQAHYPERLGRLFMIHVPYVFWGVWKMVSPLIDRVTREKIIFVEDKTLTATLAKEIPSDMLPSEYGGTGSLSLIEKVVVSKGQV